MARPIIRRLFAELSANLAHLRPDFPGRILCPICFKVMPEEWIDLNDPLITEEHIIPEKLGGTITTLTCKKCNSTHGTELDSHLIQMIRSQDSLDGISARPTPGRLEIGSNQLPTNIIFDAVSSTVEFRMRQSHPRALQEAKRFFEDNPASPDDPVTIKFEFDAGYIPNRAFLALLRIAYLAMFKNLGYAYVGSPAADVIRQLIIKYEDPPPDLGRILLRNILPAAETPLVFVRLSNAAVLVVMRLIAETKAHYYGTVMPSPDLGAANVLETLCSAAETLRRRRPIPANR